MHGSKAQQLEFNQFLVVFNAIEYPAPLGLTTD